MKLAVIPFIFLCATLCAQTSFVKFLDSGKIERNKVFDLMYDLDDNSVFVLGNDADTFFLSLKLMKFDTTGSLIKESVFASDSSASFILSERNNICKVDSGIYQVFGNTSFGLDQFVYRFNSELDSVSYFIAEENANVTSNFGRKSYNINSKIYLSGTKTKFNNFIMFNVTEINGIGEIMWEYFYNQADIVTERLEYLSPLSNNELLLCGYKQKQGTNELGVAFVRLNKDGQFVELIQNEELGYGGAISEVVPFMSNSGEERLAFGNAWAYNDNGTFLGVVRYMITDMLGNIVDSIRITHNEGMSEFLTYNRRVENSFIASGQRTISFDPYKTMPFVVKINESSDTVWTTTVDMGLSAEAVEVSEVTGMSILPSGSIMLCGNHIDYSVSPSIRRPFIIKLDKDGCLVPGCRPISSIDDLDKKDEPIIYPNPIVDKLTLELEIKGTLYLTDINGRLLGMFKLEKGANAIDASSLPKGVILYSIISDTSYDTGKLIKM